MSIIGCGITADLFSAGAQGLVAGGTSPSISWSGGTVTVNTAAAHGLSGSFGLALTGIGGASVWATPNGVVATVTTSTQFTYPLAGNPGTDSIALQWSQLSTSALKIRAGASSAITINSVSTNGPFYEGAIVFETNGTNMVMNGVIAQNVLSGQPVWTLPSNPTGLTCVGCNNPTLFSTFSQLPGQASGLSGLTVTEAMQYDLSDCNTSTFLATAAAGGSGATAHRRVRYNAASSVWQVVG